MGELLKIAWRNLWRNKRRTLITMASIFFSALIAIFTRSMQLGTYGIMLNSLVEQFSGHLQLQNKDYYLNPSIDNLLPYSQSLIDKLGSYKEITFFNPRLQAGAMFIGNGNSSRVGMVVGIDINKEREFSHLNEKVAHFKVDSAVILKLDLPQQLQKLAFENLLGYYTTKEKIERDFVAYDRKFKDYIDKIVELSKFKGEYFRSDSDRAVLVGSKLAELLNVSVGDSIIILSQGYYGASAVGKYVIRGILHFPNPQFNETFVYMPLQVAQDLFSAYDFDNEGNLVGLVSYVSINTVYPASLKPIDYVRLQQFRDRLFEDLKQFDLRVLTWKEINRELDQQIQSDNVGGIVMIMVLFVIIALGVLGTVMMMTLERKKEFGIQIAIGMKRSKLIKVVGLEILLMALVASMVAVLVALPLILLLHQTVIYIPSASTRQAYEMFNLEPLLKFAGLDWYIAFQVLVVTLITLLTIVYPIWFILKLKVADALRA